MGLFKRKEKRAADGTVGIEDCLLSALIGGSSEVTKVEALQIPTVAACVNLIADRISALPIKLYRQEGKEVTEITEDKRLDMLNHDTGDTINATEMKKLWIRDYFLGKGSYTYIERNLFNEPMGLLYVDESRLAVAPGADPIHKTYSIQVNGRVYFPYQFLKILRNSKGFGTGTSIISEDPLALAIYYNTMKYENATIRKGGNKKGYILSKTKLTQDALDKVKEAWRKLYSNSYDTKDNAVVLNDGLDFKESSSTSVELQLNENKHTNADEICKLFCMPADVLNGKANEAMISQFVQNCLMPLINTIESALDSDLLTESEKAGHYYWAFDTSELTRGDFVSRMNGYATALQNNIYQLDEIREKEDLPPLGFNFIKLGLDAVLVDPKTREIYTPNTGKLEKMNAEHLTDEQLRAIIENRYNENHDPKSGRFTSGGSSGGVLLGEHELSEDVRLDSANQDNSKPITQITDAIIDKVPLVSITGYSVEQCAEIQRQHQELLRYSRKNNECKEVAFVFSNNIDLSSRKEFIGTDDETILNFDSFSGDVFVMHNHPRNSSYSYADIVEFVGNDRIKTLSIVKNNGRVETLTKKKSFEKRDYIVELIRLKKKEVKTDSDNEYRKIVDKFLTNHSKGGVFEWLR